MQMETRDCFRKSFENNLSPCTSQSDQWFHGGNGHVPAIGDYQGTVIHTRGPDPAIFGNRLFKVVIGDKVDGIALVEEGSYELMESGGDQPFVFIVNTQLQ